MHKATFLGGIISVLVISLALDAFGEKTEVHVGSVTVTVPGKAGKNIAVHVETVDRSTTGDVDEKAGTPIELGKVAWLTDFDEAAKRSKHSSKPIMLLFDEVPGCGACKDFGRGALSNPLVLEAANGFVCVFAQNNSNDPLKKAFLKRFNEPGWKGPVVRFVDADGKDVIPRKAGVYKTVELLRRMAEASKAAKQDVPVWLALVGKQSADKTETATFAMNCYWTGEKELGAIDGVISTKIGALKLEEVVELEFNPKVVSYEELLKKARRVNCTRHVFARNDDQARSATKLLGEKRVTKTDKAVNIHTRQQYHLWHRMEYNYLPLLPIQASHVNSALGKRESPEEFLSPGQVRFAKRILAIVKADKEVALEVLKSLNPSRTARGMGVYMAQLERVVGEVEKDKSPTGNTGQPAELGNVRWGRDFDKAVTESKSTGRPLMVLFDEVPGCGGCKVYGKVLLSHPVLVEAAETSFVPVFIRNNDRDRNSPDTKLLRRFGERAWNYPVVRFMSADGKDIAPASRTWSIRKGAWAELLANMAKALDAAKRPTPKYLALFMAQYGARKIATVRFSMPCYWVGEAKLGALPGVVRTRVGSHKLAHEIVEVVFDNERTDYRTIARAARQQRCARHIILSADDPNFETAKEVFGAEGIKVSATPCTFKDNDYNYQFHIYRQWGYFFNAITSLQATRMHGDKTDRASYLSPRQQALRKRIEARFKDLDKDARKALFERMKKDLNPSQYRNLYTMTLNEYQAKLIAYLEKLEAGGVATP